MALDRALPPDVIPKADPEAIWATAKRADAVETFPGEEVFSLTPKEAERCRFKLSDDTREKDMGMAECTVHTTKSTHGVRLFPKHLWNIRSDGRLEYKENQSSPWREFSPKTRTLDKE